MSSGSIIQHAHPAMPTSTMWVIIAVCVFLLAWEIYVIDYKKQTISKAMHILSHRHPILLIMIGILLGHFFW